MKYLLIFVFIYLSCSLMAQELTVMTYNIHHGRNNAGKVDINRIAEVINASGADLIGLQEVDSVCRRSGNVDQMKELGRLTGMYHTFRKHFDYDGGAYGLGILSRFPIQEIRGHRISSFSEKKEEKKTLVFLTTKISIDEGNALYFGTVHFDYRKDPVIRLKQTEEVLRIIEKVDAPFILTGDLNAEPHQEEIGSLFQKFYDTDLAGKNTFPASEPAKKLDYILISKKHLADVPDHKVINEPEASDHRPVFAEISVKY